MTRPFIAGNWKMYNGTASARRLARALREELAGVRDVEMAVFPAFVHLAAVVEELAGSNVGVGGQDAHWEKEGAYTGEVSVAMLRDLGCGYVIVGHSERRTQLGETDQVVNRKLKAALAGGLVPIVCIGETDAQREAGATAETVAGQLSCSLAGLEARQIATTVIAYEPVWAIGTGKTATPEQAQEVHGLIRGMLAAAYGDRTAAAVRIQYGGSVKPDNAARLMAQPDVDGALVGGASLEADAFGTIVRQVLKTEKSR